MYPPQRRARGISYVLFVPPSARSSVRRCSGRCSPGASSTRPRDPAAWLVAAWISLSRLGLIFFARPHPKWIADLLAEDADEPAPPPAPLGQILRRPGVVPAMIAALASFGVMVSVMNLSGYVVLEHHHHAQSASSR